jgi:hypothetical protein
MLAVRKDWNILTLRIHTGTWIQNLNSLLMDSKGLCPTVGIVRRSGMRVDALSGKVSFDLLVDELRTIVA